MHVDRRIFDLFSVVLFFRRGWRALLILGAVHLLDKKSGWLPRVFPDDFSVRHCVRVPFFVETTKVP
ncbi:hypothetical protein M6B38_320335 [Iris pallida]|uniref:Secreted protein n=1 Tax=Iris pallida TaxID=29817 RepID=A0AAX6HB65_IRIPA|nr:hypothetical protein M6B38_320335 [Iris pallida]